jgi:hypothetical protein
MGHYFRNQTTIMVPQHTLLNVVVKGPVGRPTPYVQMHVQNTQTPWPLVHK